MQAKKILVCDDEPHILHVVSTKLRNAGYEVITAPDGEEGFEAAKAQKPDLILTDYQMPFLSGLELAVKLQADPQTAEIPLIMLTARGYSLESGDLKNSNIRKVLPKPFSPREVLASVQAILNATEAPVV
ncbi:MAG TPA: response regulator [Phycisphaerae bacterium]|nr:response regulator [Phycisphaerae bacterium]